MDFVITGVSVFQNEFCFCIRPSDEASEGLRCQTGQGQGRQDQEEGGAYQGTVARILCLHGNGPDLSGLPL